MRLAIDPSHVRHAEAGDRFLELHAVDKTSPQPVHDGINLRYSIWGKHVCRDVSRIEQRFLHLLYYDPLDLI